MVRPVFFILYVNKLSPEIIKNMKRHFLFKLLSIIFVISVLFYILNRNNIIFNNDARAVEMVSHSIVNAADAIKSRNSDQIAQQIDSRFRNSLMASLESVNPEVRDLFANGLKTAHIPRIKKGQDIVVVMIEIPIPGKDETVATPVTYAKQEDGEWKIIEF